MDLYKRLANIQHHLKAPKGQYNNFGKYKYRSCEDILESVKPLLMENGCVLHLSDHLEMVGERYYIKAVATLADCETGESVTVSAYAREEEAKKGMDGSQVTGAASSYARKYALNRRYQGFRRDGRTQRRSNKGIQMPRLRQALQRVCFQGRTKLYRGTSLSHG